MIAFAIGFVVGVIAALYAKLDQQRGQKMMVVYIVYKQTDCKKTEIGRSTDQKTAIKILQEACDSDAGGCLYVMTQINEGEEDDGCAV